jgi:hypothetical protein
VVWSGYGLEHSENVRLWFDAGDLVAYACFEPPMSLEFDLMPGFARYDPVGREIFEWGESYRRTSRQSGKTAVPRALAMLGYEAVFLTMSLKNDVQRTCSCSGVATRAAMVSMSFTDVVLKISFLRQSTDHGCDSDMRQMRTCGSAWTFIAMHSQCGDLQLQLSKTTGACETLQFTVPSST